MSSKHFMTSIFKPPYHVSVTFAFQSSGVTKRRDILANFLGISVIVFKLNPSCLAGKTSQLIQ